MCGKKCDKNIVYPLSQSEVANSNCEFWFLVYLDIHLNKAANWNKVTGWTRVLEGEVVYGVNF